MSAPDIPTIFSFLRNIGLKVVEYPGASGFTEGVDIKDGVLLVDTDVVKPSNLLHEAGHLAIVPPEFRALFQTNVAGGQEAAFAAALQMGAEPDSPMLKAVMQTSDPEATAWAWAAGKHLGIDDDRIILDEEYGDQGENIRVMLQIGRYAGIHGLANAGFCAVSKAVADYRDIPLYPALSMWSQHSGLALN